MEPDGGEVARLVRARGRTCTALRADFADRAAVTDLAAQLADWSPAIDILVNNAGTIARAPAAEHTDEDWDHVLHVDLTSQFILARAVGRAMLDRGHGKIIFTASLLSFQGGINVPGYAAAKSGVAGLTRALANEWASRGVNVNAIAPGYVTTDNTRALRDDPPATPPSSTGFRLAAGPIPRTSRAPWSSSPPAPPTTSTARYLR